MTWEHPPSFNSKQRQQVIGNRAFSVAGPPAWSSLPVELKTITDITRFKRELKTLLFTTAYDVSTQLTFRFIVDACSYYFLYPCNVCLFVNVRSA